MKNKIKLNIDSFLEYVLALLLILGANSVYSVTIKYNFHINILTSLVLLLYVLKKIIIKKNIKEIINNIKTLLEKHYLFYIIFYTVLIIFALINDVNQFNFVSLFLIILPLFVLLYSENENTITTIMKKVLDLTVIIAITSLLSYLLIDILKVIDYTGELGINWGEEKLIKSFLNIYFQTQYFQLNNLYIVRNTGIFVEAPMYSLILILAISYYEFFIENQEKNSLLIRAILIITLLTTFSTTGYLLLIIIYLYKVFRYLMRKNSRSLKNNSLKYIVIVISIIAVALCAFLLVNRLRTSSGSTRVDDYVASYKAWINSSIIKGVGFGNEDTIKLYMSDFRKDNQGLSNSLMVIIAEGGLYLLLIYFIPFLISSISFYKQKKYEYLYFNVIVLFLLISTIFFCTNTMINILSIWITYMIKHIKEKSKDN